MITIYVYGCASCGVTAKRIREVQNYGKKYGVSVEVLNSKYNSEHRQLHASFLSGVLKRPADSYEPMIVNGGIVMLLED